jgi:hypothetical protein
MKTPECGKNNEEVRETLVYLLSPVRNVTDDQALAIAEHAKSLDKPGIRLFNPVKDAPQQDATGYNIVMAELNFMHEAALNGGRADVLWNMGGRPSEGSRVDIGIALALGLQINLVTVFNAEEPTGPQICLNFVKGEGKEIIKKVIEDIQSCDEVIIDWDMEFKTKEQEWMRIFLGLALGEMAKNPKLRIKLGQVIGIDPPEMKSYVKVVKEIEARQGK